MKQRLLTRVAPSVGLAAVLFPVLYTITPVPEQGEAVFMSLSLALLAGMVFYFASGVVRDAAPRVYIALLAFIGVSLAAGMVIRTLSLTQSNNTDYIYCLGPWAQSFRDLGWKAIAETWSDYNMPYLYIVGVIAKIPMNDLYLYKLVSVIFDCGIIIAGLRLARVLKLSDLKKAVLVGALFLAPTVWLNSSFWGQCDAVYAFFCLMALTFALEDRPSLSAVMAAIAFSFKLQTIFILPIFIILWMLKRVRLREIPIFLGTFVALFLPAWFLGRPFTDIINVYLHQSKQYSSRLNLNSPSAYALLWTDEPHDILFSAGLFLAFCFLGALLLIAWLKRDRINNRILFCFALAMVIGIPWLLPSMHDRYFYLADILCIFLAVMVPKKWYFAPLCVFCSYAGYHAFLFGKYIPYFTMAVPSLIMMLLMGSAVYLTISELREAV